MSSLTSVSEESICLMRNSFNDRIYDDLCEDILQWLPIDDKIKLIGVSKQFQRCLQTLWLRQTIFKIDLKLENDKNNFEFFSHLISNELLNEKLLQTVFNTFPNINEIHFGIIDIPINSEGYAELILNAVIKYWPQIQSLTVLPVSLILKLCSHPVIEQFGQTFGSNLKTINIKDESFEKIKLLVEYSPNLLSINYIKFEDLFENNRILVKKLKRLKVIKVSDKNLFEIFVDNNPGLTDLDIQFTFDSCHQRTDSIAKLSELKKLKVLKIKIEDICHSYDPKIVNSIQLIAKNCKYLVSFGLEVESRQSFDTRHFFESMDYFSTLKRLSINSHDSCTPNPIPIQRLDSNFMQNCKDLTHFEIISDQIDDQFFVEIDLLFPNLKHLVVEKVDLNVTDITFKTLTKLKNFESLLIKQLDYSLLESISESGFQTLFNGCKRLHTFGVFSKIRLTETTINLLIEKAVRNPLVFYKYYLRGIENCVDVEELIKTSGHQLNNICITGSKHVFEKIRDFN